MSALDMTEELRWTPLPPYPIEHVMVFTFRTDAHVTATLAGLNSLASLPELLYLHAGPILRARNYNYESEAFTHLLHARFPSVEAFQLFRKHPEFSRVVGELMMANVTNVVTVEWLWPPSSWPKTPLQGQTVNLSLFKFKGDRLRRWFGERRFNGCFLEMKRTYAGCPPVKSLGFGTELWGLTESAEPYSAGAVAVINGLTAVLGERNEREFDYLMRVSMLDADRFAGEYGVGIANVVSVDYKVMVPSRKSAGGIANLLHLDALCNVVKDPTSVFVICSMISCLCSSCGVYWLPF